ncbi:hypothetical protein P3S68_023221 [Capsicum galapagoense]
MHLENQHMVGRNDLRCYFHVQGFGFDFLHLENLGPPLNLCQVSSCCFLASSIIPIVAQDAIVTASDGLTEVIELPMAKEIEVEASRHFPLCDRKIRWPELVGKDGKEAKKIIEKENTKVKAFILPVGHPKPRIIGCIVFVFC